jgi:hypothetical protein
MTHHAVVERFKGSGVQTFDLNWTVNWHGELEGKGMFGKGMETREKFLELFLCRSFPCL